MVVAIGRNAVRNTGTNLAGPSCPQRRVALIGAGCRSERSGSRLSAANPKVALTRGVEAGDWS